MEHLIKLFPGSNQQKRELEQEMEEFGRTERTLILQKCQIKNQAITCPIPRKNTSWNKENHDFTVLTDFSDIILSEASSPPYFDGSPPIRVSNPLIHDLVFREKRVQIAER